MRDGAPVLLAVAHGTRSAAGVAAVRELLRRVRALRPWVPVAEAYAEIAEPRLEDALRAAGDRPVVPVPLLLARGYHALIDIPGRVERLRPDALPGRPLGPDPLLADALAARLRALGEPRRGDAVVLAAAGSSDPVGVADVEAAARLLSRRLRRPVATGFVAAGGPSLADVVADLRAAGAERVLAASYVLAPGFFHDRMAASGADAVTAPLGAHDAVARLLLRRYDQARLSAGSAVPVP
ncbi:Sirohydrochlorin ferrochelatase [Actinomadura rubteroloni]|uniref:Sirohydrochlorin ferrochelatase n=1 Tax=Actinomadura rubteroloni TaxID=1926885 RepID=A0A2P4UBS8_9ACTN|nr:CbiX/SirB N-terminal domain-containing protein [Actinomadura rubteroloni]POM22496.1 Sirohydrochlorin ferrochelatase [Actinomadura rubteroloni]